MAACTDVSQRDSGVWSFSGAAAPDLGGGACAWDVFCSSINVHLGLRGSAKSALGPGSAALGWTWLWGWDAERLGFGLTRLGGLAAEAGAQEGEAAGRDIGTGL